MSKGSRFAMALVLFWIAFLCFYVAFHPGGIQVPGPDPQTNKGKTHAASNPVEVFKQVITNLATKGQQGGVPESQGGGA